MGPIETALALLRVAAVCRFAEDHAPPKGTIEAPLESDLLTAFRASPELVDGLEMSPSTSWAHGPNGYADLIGDADHRPPHAELKAWSRVTLDQFQYMAKNAGEGADLVVITSRRRTPELTSMFRGVAWRVITMHTIVEQCAAALRRPDVAQAAADMGEPLRVAVGTQALRSVRLI